MSNVSQFKYKLVKISTEEIKAKIKIRKNPKLSLPFDQLTKDQAIRVNIPNGAMNTVNTGFRKQIQNRVKYYNTHYANGKKVSVKTVPSEKAVYIYRR